MVTKNWAFFEHGLNSGNGHQNSGNGHKKFGHFGQKIGQVGQLRVFAGKFKKNPADGGGSLLHGGGLSGAHHFRATRARARRKTIFGRLGGPARRARKNSGIGHARRPKVQHCQQWIDTQELPKSVVPRGTEPQRHSPVRKISCLTPPKAINL